MRIHLTSVMVDDQDKALDFYTRVLGFVKKTRSRSASTLADRRLARGPDGTELLLEPDGHPAVGPFKAALVADGIPFTSFAVDDVHAEHERLVAAGGAVHPAAADDGPGHDRGLRRHLRQPDPDRQPGLAVGPLLAPPAGWGRTGA